MKKEEGGENTIYKKKLHADYHSTGECREALELGATHWSSLEIFVKRRL